MDIIKKILFALLISIFLGTVNCKAQDESSFISCIKQYLDDKEPWVENGQTKCLTFVKDMTGVSIDCPTAICGYNLFFGKDAVHQNYDIIPQGSVVWYDRHPNNSNSEWCPEGCGHVGLYSGKNDEGKHTIISVASQGFGVYKTLMESYSHPENVGGFFKADLLGYTTPQEYMKIGSKLQKNQYGCDIHYENSYFWSGNGSIVSYHAVHQIINLYPADIDTLYGINYDVVWIRPPAAGDYGVKPVAYFQWQVNSGTCPKLKIDAPPRSINSTGCFLDSSENHVDITVGTWNNRDYDRTISDVSLPFVIDLGQFTYATNSGDWWMVQIAFQNPVENKVRLKAMCTNEPGSPGSQTLSNPVVYEKQKWAGCGSLLSYAFQSIDMDQPGGLPHGSFLDYVYVHPSEENAIGFFQWQYFQNYPCVALDATNTTLTPEQKKANIFIRAWDSQGVNGDSSEEQAFENVSLPFKLCHSMGPYLPGQEPDGNLSWSVQDKDWLQIKFRMRETNIRTSIKASLTAN